MWSEGWSVMGITNVAGLDHGNGCKRCSIVEELNEYGLLWEMHAQHMCDSAAVHCSEGLLQRKARIEASCSCLGSAQYCGSN